MTKLDIALIKQNPLYDLVNNLQTDRDRWKARAEALEKAIKSPDVNEWNASRCPACMTCTGYEHERNCGRNCGEGRKGWQFDEAEFGGELK